jgi:hypothetical protein
MRAICKRTKSEISFVKEYLTISKMRLNVYILFVLYVYKTNLCFLYLNLCFSVTCSLFLVLYFRW